MVWCCLLFWLTTTRAVDMRQYNGCYRQYCFTSMGAYSQSNGNEFLKNFSEARNWCRSLGPGHGLITVETKDKHEALLEFLTDHEYMTDVVWIAGGQVIQNQWMWVNGTPYSGEHFHMDLCVDGDNVIEKQNLGDSNYRLT
jgi:Lectin C-type domain